MGSSSVNQAVLDEEPKKLEDFCVRLGNDDAVLVGQTLLVLDGVGSESEIQELARYQTPPGTRVYENHIHKRGIVPLSRYLGVKDFDASFLFSNVPAVGEYPRLLFSYEDLDQVREKLSKSPKGSLALTKLNRSLEIELEAADNWFHDLAEGIIRRIQKPRFMEDLCTYAFNALLTADDRPDLAIRVARATYTAIRTLMIEDETRSSSTSFERNHDILLRGYDILFAFDFSARFMAARQVTECMDFFVKLGKVDDRGVLRGMWSMSAQHAFEGESENLINLRGSNQDVWISSTLNMLDILNHGWNGSNELNTHHWVFYWQRMIRSIHTVHGTGIEPTGKEANDRLPLVAIALKRILPNSPNLLNHPQFYRSAIAKVHQLFPHSPHVNDLGTWCRPLIRGTPLATLMPGSNPFFSFISRIQDAADEAFLPPHLRDFGASKPGTYGFLRNRGTVAGMDLAFTTSPLRPKHADEGPNQSFIIGPGVGAESVIPIIRAGKPFDVTVSLLDLGFELRKRDNDVFSIVYREKYYGGLVVTETKGGEQLLCLAVGEMMGQCVPRISSQRFKVQLVFEPQKVFLKVNGVTTGPGLPLPIIPGSTDLWFVAGYHLQRTDPGELARMLDCAIEKINIYLGLGRTIEWANFRKDEMDLEFRPYFPIEELYQIRESKLDIRKATRDESVVDKRVLQERLPGLWLDFSDDEIGQFISRSSFSDMASSAVLHTSIMGHNKKSSGHVDIIGVGLPWITPSRRLAPNSEEYMAIAVNGRYPPGMGGSMVGSYIGAQRSKAGAGAAVDLTMAYRHDDKFFRGDDEYIDNTNEPPLTDSSIDVAYAFRSVAYLRMGGDRGVTLVVDEVKMNGDGLHNFTLSAGFDKEDEIIDAVPLQGEDGDFSFTMISSRRLFQNTDPPSANGYPTQYLDASQDLQSRRQCYVKVLRGSPQRRTIGFQIRELYGSPDYFQGFDPSIHYKSTVRFTRHFGNQLRLSISDSPSAAFITAYYPYLDGENIPLIKWVGQDIHVYPAASSPTHGPPLHVISLDSSAFTQRTIVRLQNEWSLDP
uniref:Uncharacterized protein n=1 Tax=Compsopogon caeruleus TaxID=31354 RepID=A0A7S1TIK0_9RHOD|mmetsp:Transcript_9402/g.19237  ORF Transcript_9402/g.19237 Transcript_9402/m.19237 type:complete len:1051 (+) Transcript_9402:2149-5301(+)